MVLSSLQFNLTDDFAGLMMLDDDEGNETGLSLGALENIEKILFEIGNLTRQPRPRITPCLLQQAQGMDETSLPCEERFFYRTLMGWGFLLVFFLALTGNCINIFIYNSDQIRFYIAIRMLCTKLVSFDLEGKRTSVELMNTLAMLFLLPQALRTVQLWESDSPTEATYWKFWPYQTYFVNFFGFCAMWLTVLMTAECYLHVFLPGHSKALCTRKNLSRSYMVIAAVGCGLSLIYPLNRFVVQDHDVCNRSKYVIHSHNSTTMVVVERAHTVGNLLAAILVPLALLVFMTVSIAWRLIIRPPSEITGSQHFSSEKRCVTRITLITTILQLVSEIPAVPVFIYAAYAGPEVSLMCVWHSLGLFLGVCNLSLSFFVYIAFSHRFRAMLFNRAKAVLQRLMPCLGLEVMLIKSRYSQTLDPTSKVYAQVTCGGDGPTQRSLLAAATTTSPKGSEYEFTSIACDEPSNASRSSKKGGRNMEEDSFL